MTGSESTSKFGNAFKAFESNDELPSAFRSTTTTAAKKANAGATGGASKTIGTKSKVGSVGGGKPTWMKSSDNDDDASVSTSASATKSWKPKKPIGAAAASKDADKTGAASAKSKPGSVGGGKPSWMKSSGDDDEVSVSTSTSAAKTWKAKKTAAATTAAASKDTDVESKGSATKSWKPKPKEESEEASASSSSAKCSSLGNFMEKKQMKSPVKKKLIGSKTGSVGKKVIKSPGTKKKTLGAKSSLKTTAKPLLDSSSSSITMSDSDSKGEDAFTSPDTVKKRVLKRNKSASSTAKKLGGSSSTLNNSVSTNDEDDNGMLMSPEDTTGGAGRVKSSSVSAYAYKMKQKSTSTSGEQSSPKGIARRRIGRGKTSQGGNAAKSSIFAMIDNAIENEPDAEYLEKLAAKKAAEKAAMEAPIPDVLTSREAEALRLKQEAEEARLKKEADAARLKKEAQALKAKKQAEAKAKKEAEAKAKKEAEELAKKEAEAKAKAKEDALAAAKARLAASKKVTPSVAVQPKRVKSFVKKTGTKEENDNDAQLKGAKGITKKFGVASEDGGDSGLPPALRAAAKLSSQSTTKSKPYSATRLRSASIDKSDDADDDDSAIPPALRSVSSHSTASKLKPAVVTNASNHSTTSAPLRTEGAPPALRSINAKKTSTFATNAKTGFGAALKKTAKDDDSSSDEDDDKPTVSAASKLRPTTTNASSHSTSSSGTNSTLRPTATKKPSTFGANRFGAGLNKTPVKDEDDSSSDEDDNQKASPKRNFGNPNLSKPKSPIKPKTPTKEVKSPVGQSQVIPSKSSEEVQPKSPAEESPLMKQTMPEKSPAPDVVVSEPNDLLSQPPLLDDSENSDDDSSVEVKKETANVKSRMEDADKSMAFSTSKSMLDDENSDSDDDSESDSDNSDDEHKFHFSYTGDKLKAKKKKSAYKPRKKFTASLEESDSSDDDSDYDSDASDDSSFVRAKKRADIVMKEGFEFEPVGDLPEKSWYPLERSGDMSRDLEALEAAIADVQADRDATLEELNNLASKNKDNCSRFMSRKIRSQKIVNEKQAAKDKKRLNKEKQISEGLKADNKRFRATLDKLPKQMARVKASSASLEEANEEIADHFESLSEFATKLKADHDRLEEQNNICRDEHLPKHRQELWDRKCLAESETKIKLLYRSMMHRILERAERSRQTELLEEIRGQIEEVELELDPNFDMKKYRQALNRTNRSKSSSADDSDSDSDSSSYDSGDESD